MKKMKKIFKKIKRLTEKAGQFPTPRDQEQIIENVEQHGRIIDELKILRDTTLEAQERAQRQLNTFEDLKRTYPAEITTSAPPVIMTPEQIRDVFKYEE